MSVPPAGPAQGSPDPAEPPPPWAPKPKKPIIGILALILGIVSFIPYLGCLTCIPAIGCGIVGISQSRHDAELGGKGMGIAGIVMGTLAILLMIAWYAAGVAIPRYKAEQHLMYTQAAEQAGRRARVAMELYYQETGGMHGGRFTNKLDNLLTIDPTLDDDPEIAFEFGSYSKKGYTFTTWHLKGGDGILLTDQ